MSCSNLVVNKKFWTLEVSRCNTDIVLLSGMIELSQSPVNQAKLSILMINHHIMWLYISMHYSLTMTIVQRLQQKQNNIL